MQISMVKPGAIYGYDKALFEKKFAFTDMFSPMFARGLKNPYEAWKMRWTENLDAMLFTGWITADQHKALSAALGSIPAFTQMFQEQLCREYRCHITYDTTGQKAWILPDGYAGKLTEKALMQGREKVFSNI